MPESKRLFSIKIWFSEAFQNALKILKLRTQIYVHEKAIEKAWK